MRWGGQFELDLNLNNIIITSSIEMYTAISSTGIAQNRKTPVRVGSIGIALWGPFSAKPDMLPARSIKQGTQQASTHVC